MLALRPQRLPASPTRTRSVTIPPELEAKILRYCHVERWRPGTIAAGDTDLRRRLNALQSLAFQQGQIAATPLPRRRGGLRGPAGRNQKLGSVDRRRRGRGRQAAPTPIASSIRSSVIKLATTSTATSVAVRAECLIHSEFPCAASTASAIFQMAPSDNTCIVVESAFAVRKRAGSSVESLN